MKLKIPAAPGARSLTFTIDPAKAAVAAHFAAGELKEGRPDTAASAMSQVITSWDHCYGSPPNEKVMAIDGVAVGTLGPETLAEMVAAIQQAIGPPPDRATRARAARMLG